MGLTRFNLPPDPSQQPSRTKRSQSHPRLNDITSRLNEETQSFASKKTQARRSVSKSPVLMKKKPLVSYPISPRTKTKPVSPTKSPATVIKGVNVNLQLDEAIQSAAKLNIKNDDLPVEKSKTNEEKKTGKKVKKKTERKQKNVEVEVWLYAFVI